MLPSTRYAPDGEIYAACWRNNHYQQPNNFLPHPSQPPPSIPPIPQTQYRCQRPQNLPLISPQINSEKEENFQLAPKSPSHSAITLLNINGCNNVQQQQIRYATPYVVNNNFNFPATQIQTQNASSSNANIIRFPRTQLLQRRRSAAANSPSENAPPLERHQRPQRSRSNREKSADCEKDERFKQWNACYYGRDIVKLMERHIKRQVEIENRSKMKLIMNKKKEEGNENMKEEKIEKFFGQPPQIFNFEQELFFSTLSTENDKNQNKFVGRKWIFNKLEKILKEEKVKVVLLVGASGSGKSAIIRYLIENSYFGRKLGKRKTSSSTQLEGQQEQQNNTVDSGIVVVSDISTNPSPLGSQTSLNEENFKNSDFNNSDNSDFYFLGQNICAFHFAHLHDSKRQINYFKLK
uniref:Uncharacterized protein n=1 Tax=Meloidogyne enterolobii TaxID=390850 RepID=A0A6V7VFE2_MELEN|nr:unnamed protein product [Meloidogyne enterolobii]